jgi:hypothetical protein
MRIPTLAAAAILIAAMGGAGAAPAQAARHKATHTCTKKGAHTVARSREARLFTVRGRDAEGDPASTLYGCLLRGGHPKRLAFSGTSDTYTGTRFASVRLAGRYAAWYSLSSDDGCAKYSLCPPGYDGTSRAIDIFDLKRRRALRTVVVSGDLLALALTQTGGVAWITAAGAGANQVTAVDAAGQRVLDTGGIAPGSLNAEISIVSWVRDGVERFARLR